MAEDKLNNMMAGLVLMTLKVDEFKAGLREVTKAAINGEKVDPSIAPEALYIIGASETLTAILKCAEDPLAGVNSLEKNVSDLRFHAQLATMGEES